MASTQRIRIIASQSPLPGDIVLSFVNSQRCDSTRRSYSNDMNDLAALLNINSIDDLLGLQPESIVAYRNMLIERRQAPLTVGRKLTTVRQFYRYCISRGYLQHNPADNRLVKSPRRTVETRTQGLTRFEAALLLDSIKRHSLKDKRDYAILMLMLHHGLRRAEVATLRTSSIGSERNYTTLTICGKGSKARVHPMQAAVLEAIKQYLTADKRSLYIDGALFSSTRLMHPISTEAIAQIVATRCKAAGITKKITPHSLRHTSITAALDGGASLRRVSQFAGHSSPLTTSLYDLNRENLDDNAAHQILYR